MVVRAGVRIRARSRRAFCAAPPLTAIAHAASIGVRITGHAIFPVLADTTIYRFITNPEGASRVECYAIPWVSAHASPSLTDIVDGAIETIIASCARDTWRPRVVVLGRNALEALIIRFQGASWIARTRDETEALLKSIVTTEDIRLHGEAAIEGTGQ